MPISIRPTYQWKRSSEETRLVHCSFRGPSASNMHMIFFKLVFSSKTVCIYDTIIVKHVLGKYQ